MPDIEWSEASGEVIRIAEALIDKFHPWLKGARIGFMFRSEPQKSKGREVYGGASKVPDKLKTYLDYDFLIWIAEDVYTTMDRSRRAALIDHELSHCYIGKSGWTIRGHDFEDFIHIVRRHGLWTPALMEINKAESAYQLDLGLSLVDALTKQGKVEAVNPDKINPQPPEDDKRDDEDHPDEPDDDDPGGGDGPDDIAPVDPFESFVSELFEKDGDE